MVCYPAMRSPGNCHDARAGAQLGSYFAKRAQLFPTSYVRPCETVKTPPGELQLDRSSRRRQTLMLTQKTVALDQLRCMVAGGASAAIAPVSRAHRRKVLHNGVQAAEGSVADSNLLVRERATCRRIV